MIKDTYKSVLYWVYKVLGFCTLVIVFYAVWEWNSVTGSYWGYLYLVIAVPGLFLPLWEYFRKRSGNK